MDQQTQQSLMTIHQHLMENGRVKTRFMTNSSQLVNDKKVKKDRLSSVKIADDHGGGGSGIGRCDDSSSTAVRRHTTISSEEGLKNVLRSEKSMRDDALSSSVHSSSVHSQSTQSCSTTTNTDYEIGKRQPPRGKDKKSSSSVKLGSSKPLSSSSSSSSSSSNSPSKIIANGLASVKLRSVNRINSISSSSSRSGSGSSGSSNGGGGSPATKQRLSWMETLKKKQKSLRLKQLADSNANNESQLAQEGKSPMTVTLRRVSPRKKQRTTPPSTPKEGIQPSAPWAKVQLRSTPKKRESMTPTLQPTTTTALRPATLSLHPVIQSNGSWNSAASSSSSSWVNVLPPVTHTPKQFTEASQSSSSTLPSLCCVGDIIDLDSLPRKVFPADEGEASIFPLKSSPKDPSKGGRESEKVVVVGKTAILTASTTTSSTTSRKASVTWWARRSDIRALTLNVEATGANLAHAHGRTPLLFDSADVCLDFAQAFYRGPTAAKSEVTVSQASGGGSGAPMSVPEKDSENDDAGSDMQKEETGNNVESTKKSLSKDEEQMLDQYRQYSQDDRTKLRLTCLSPRGEEREVEVSLSPASRGGNASSADMKDVALSEDEEKLASKYRKMLKMGIPPDAVKHKMTSDDINQKIMDAVLGGTGGENNASKAGTPGRNLTDEEEATASKYRKMMKMGVPEDGVRHKMAMEGVDAKIIDAVFDVTDQGGKAMADTANRQQLSDEEEVIASKYRKMLKMGVPLEGVQHKMKQDSIDSKIISALIDETSPSSNVDAESSTVKPAAASKTSTKQAALSKEEETIASKYRGMLKVCIPKEAVRHKMKQEGISAKIVEAVLGKDANESGHDNGSNTASVAKAVNNRKTIAFHWTTSNLAPELLERSIFGLKKRKLSSINPEEADIKKLEELFQKRDNSKTGKIKTGTQVDASGNDMAKILDITRANNIAISLKAFNDFTFRSLAETINDLDPDSKIVGERVQFIPSLLPTPKEVQAIKKYNGDDDKLITAELFFRQLVSIKRIEDKVKVMQTMSTFEEHIEEACAGFNTLQEVCSQVMESEKLIAVLEMVLNIGNLMNAGTLDGGVEAFKFESLSRLSQTKSADGKTTVLDYIVETFIEKGERQALLLTSEFPHIQVS